MLKFILHSLIYTSILCAILFHHIDGISKSNTSGAKVSFVYQGF